MVRLHAVARHGDVAERAILVIVAALSYAYLGTFRGRGDIEL